MILLPQFTWISLGSDLLCKQSLVLLCLPLRRLVSLAIQLVHSSFAMSSLQHAGDLATSRDSNYDPTQDVLGCMWSHPWYSLEPMDCLIEEP